LFAFQQQAVIKPAPPPVKMQGLNGTARYKVESSGFNGTLSGNTLMNGGLNLQWTLADYQSMLIWLYKV